MASLTFHCRKLIPFAITLLTGGLLMADESRIEVIYVNDFLFADPLVDLGNVPLDAGTEENGDGAAFQIGYFQDVSIEMNPASYGEREWSSFAPLTGMGSPNQSHHFSSIGDFDSRREGPFGFLFFPDPVAFVLDTERDEGLPEAYPARLGIRFFDGVAPETSSAYNIVTSFNPLWEMLPPTANPEVSAELDMDQHTLVWASGEVGEYQTALLLVPEPATLSLLMLGALIMGSRSRRR